MKRNIPKYLKYVPLDGQCQPYYDSLVGVSELSDSWLNKPIYVIEYGLVIATNPDLKVPVDLLFDKEFTKNKKLMGRSIYGVRESDDSIRIVVYDRHTMRTGTMFLAHIFSEILLPYTDSKAEELIINFDDSAYKQFVKEFRKKYEDIICPELKRFRTSS